MEKTLREKLAEIALQWQANYGVAPSITSALSEYDAAKLVGMSEREYSDYMKEQAKLIAKGLPKGEMPKARDLSYVMIAPLDFDRMVQNILENARKHGFTDKTRTDYMVWINLSVDEKRDMYIIDFMNNGTPLPNGITKARYGLKGEKAGKTGGTGSGGYIVKSIINHYGGDYDIFCKDGITTIRIYLPIATI